MRLATVSTAKPGRRVSRAVQLRQGRGDGDPGVPTDGCGFGEFDAAGAADAGGSNDPFPPLPPPFTPPGGIGATLLPTLGRAGSAAKKF